MFLSSLLAAGVIGLANALPLTDSISSLESRQASCPGTGLKSFMPILRTINDNTTDPQFFHVQNNSFTTLTIDQVMTFTELPLTATNYYLQWAQSTSPQDFKTVGGGTVAVYTLDTAKLPAEGVLTPEVVEAAIDVTVGPHGTGRIGSAAFGGWPDSSGAREHLVGDVNATATGNLSFRLTLQEPDEVTLRQDSSNGWFLKYDC